MIRGRWIVHPETGELIPAADYHRPVPKRSDLSTPRLIRDSIDQLWNPMDGKRYDSRSNYHRAVKERGGRIVGNDLPIKERLEPQASPDIGKDIARAYDQLNGD